MRNYTNAELRALTPDQLAALIDELTAETERLHAKRRAAQQTPTPQPAPVTTPVAKLPRRARKAVEQFDAMTDTDQVAALREMGW